MKIRLAVTLVATLLLPTAALAAVNLADANVPCPTAALVLPADGVAKAEKAALVAAPSRYRGLNTKGAKVVWAKRATVAGPRGAQVGKECGTKARARTVVVALRFPHMLPSASLSQGVVAVSRFAKGYRVWSVLH
jgi:hypothetical protein